MVISLAAKGLTTGEVRVTLVRQRQCRGREGLVGSAPGPANAIS